MPMQGPLPGRGEGVLKDQPPFLQALADREEKKMITPRKEGSLILKTSTDFPCIYFVVIGNSIKFHYNLPSCVLEIGPQFCAVSASLWILLFYVEYLGNQNASAFGESK